MGKLGQRMLKVHSLFKPPKGMLVKEENECVYHRRAVANAEAAKKREWTAVGGNQVVEWWWFIA